MSWRVRWSVFGLGALLLAVGLTRPDPRLEWSATSFGIGPDGYQGVFEILAALGLPVARSFDPPEALPAGGAVWWIEPQGVCRAQRVSTEDDAGAEEWRGEEWIAAGGTAVVFLPAEFELTPVCRSVAGIDVPARLTPAQRGDRRDQGVLSQEISGTLAPHARRIEAPELSVFEEASGAVVAQVGGRPFALEHPLGQGRLVLVADARLLRNRWLGRADAALLAMDFVRAFGVPRFDERSHGLHRERSPLRFLLRSAALPTFLGLLTLGLLTVWSGYALPPRRHEVSAAAPTLTVFVDALADLYASTNDHGRVLARYRQLAADRLRRHFGLPPETPVSVLIERLTRSGRIEPARLAVLAAEPSRVDAGKLRVAAGVLDAIVDEARR